MAAAKRRPATSLRSSTRGVRNQLGGHLSARRGVNGIDRRAAPGSQATGWAPLRWPCPSDGRDLLDHHRVFDASNHLQRPAAFSTGLDIDVEDTLQALRPGHGSPALSWRWWFIRYPGLVALAPRSLRDQGAVFSVGDKHTMEACQVDSGLRHQRRQSCNGRSCASLRPRHTVHPVHKVERLKDHMRGAIPLYFCTVYRSTAES